MSLPKKIKYAGAVYVRAAKPATLEDFVSALRKISLPQGWRLNKDSGVKLNHAGRTLVGDEVGITDERGNTFRAWIGPSSNGGVACSATMNVFAKSIANEDDLAWNKTWTSVGASVSGPKNVASFAKTFLSNVLKKQAKKAKK